MTNTKLLADKIKQSGMKKGVLANRLGVSRATFYALTHGRAEFRASQIRTLCDLLGITDAETLNAIFFDRGVALKATEEEV